MQTKLKPIFFMVTLAATAILLYAANGAKAQNPAIGFFDVSSFSPTVISISPRLGHQEKMLMVDSILQIQPEGLKNQLTQ